jgi:hypothetical protein
MPHSLFIDVTSAAAADADRADLGEFLIPTTFTGLDLVSC